VVTRALRPKQQVRCRDIRRPVAHGRSLSLSPTLVVAALSAVLGALGIPGSAYAFGTGGFGHNEHEQITRAALQCFPPGEPQSSDSPCFGPRSVAQLAGERGYFGAVENPDIDPGQRGSAEAHCDNADYFKERLYPHSPSEAERQFQACVSYLTRRFDRGVSVAENMVAPKQQIAQQASLPSSNSTRSDGRCLFSADDGTGNAKCDVLLAFGRMLHGAEDFYAHSNWTDKTHTDPQKGLLLGLDNPPGLDRTAPSPLLNFTGKIPRLPLGFTTGCYDNQQGPPVYRDSNKLPGSACWQRVIHKYLTKEGGHIALDNTTGHVTTRPGTGHYARGRIAGNYARAVSGGITEARHQWKSFRDALRVRYPKQANFIICALTHDDLRNCLTFSYRAHVESRWDIPIWHQAGVWDLKTGNIPLKQPGDAVGATDASVLLGSGPLNVQGTFHSWRQFPGPDECHQDGNNDPITETEDETSVTADPMVVQVNFDRPIPNGLDGIRLSIPGYPKGAPPSYGAPPAPIWFVEHGFEEWSEPNGLCSVPRHLTDLKHGDLVYALWVTNSAPDVGFLDPAASQWGLEVIDVGRWAGGGISPLAVAHRDAKTMVSNQYGTYVLDEDFELSALP
jgi:hypothetical protein